MADITMCTGGACKSKDKCYRYLAEPNEHWQSYFSVVPYVCDYFWPIKDAVNAGRTRHRNGSISQEDPLGSN